LSAGILSGENLPSLKTVLKKVRADLTKKDAIREKAHENMRKATSLSKQAILLIHQKRLNEAKKSLADAKDIVVGLQTLANECPEIVYGGMFSAALQEYSEANIFLNLIAEARFVSPEDINVSSTDYVLGLADVVGEFRRLALDALREGDAKKGEKCLETMDEIFIELLALDEAYMLVPGLRRKSDIARRIIETTRGDITQEVRRKSLEDYLKRFETPRVKRGRRKMEK
jgi:translin